MAFSSSQLTEKDITSVLAPWITSSVRSFIAEQDEAETISSVAVDCLRRKMTRKDIEKSLSPFLSKNTSRFLDTLSTKMDQLSAAKKQGSSAYQAMQQQQPAAAAAASSSSFASSSSATLGSKRKVFSAADSDSDEEEKAAKGAAAVAAAKRSKMGAVLGITSLPPHPAPSAPAAPAPAAPSTINFAAFAAQKLQAAMAAKAAAAAAPSSSSSAAPAPAAAPASVPIQPPKPSMEDIARQALEKARQAQEPSPTQPSAPAAPARVRIDELGRLVDEHGNVLDKKMQGPVKTLNINVEREKKKRIQEKTLKMEKPPDMTKNPHYDPRVPTAAATRRARSSFTFVEQGSIIKKGEKLRERAAKQQFEEAMAQMQAAKKAAAAASEPSSSSSSSLPGGQSSLLNRSSESAPSSLSSVSAANTNTLALGKNDIGLGAWATAAAAASGEDEEFLKQKFAEREAEAFEKKRIEALAAIPVAEWWDVPYLETKSYQQSVDDGRAEEKMKIVEKRITQYIQHPVPLPPANTNGSKPVEMPLMLTKDERRRIRHQQRVAKQEEIQKKIQLGLMAPPPPKVKLGNMYRVLQMQGIQDPTQLEKIVREQRDAREAAHKKDNEARKLTPEQRKEKKKKKLLGDLTVGAQQIETAIFRCPEIFRLNRVKIEKNAVQNYLTGACVLTPEMNMLVVEGVPKGIKRFTALMLRRMNWKIKDVETAAQKQKKKALKQSFVKGGVLNGDAMKDEGEEAAKEEEESEEESEEEEEEESEDEENKGPGAIQIWHGVVKEPFFREFKFYAFREEGVARSFLAKQSCEHYFDMSKNHRDIASDVI